MPQSDTVSVEREPRARGNADQPFLFLVLQADKPLQPGLRCALADVERVVLRRSQGPAYPSAEREGATLFVSLPDRGVSASHAELRRSAGGWVIEDLGSKNGTSIGERKLSSPAALSDGDILEAGHSFLLFRAALPAPQEMPSVLSGAAFEPADLALATFVPGLGSQFARLRSVAGSNISVALQGETGTGKEVLASAVHRLSRRPGPFQAVNCGAIAASLVESELFGYRKGAFSGAAEDRPGLVRSADHGTLFLDELGDLPGPAQAALLRVLQESEVLPIGGTRPVKVDLRLVTATHRNLDGMVAGNQFRADLRARVAGFTLLLPPLRERKEDLGLLIAALLRKLVPARAERIVFSPEAARALLKHAWPENIRQLEKALGLALGLTGEARLELDHFRSIASEGTTKSVAAAEPARGPAKGPLSDKNEKRRATLVELLTRHEGNVSAVAREMGEHRNQVNRWLKELALHPEQFRR